MRVIHMFFTGGLDSSFTLMYYSRFPVEIRPYYLRDNRPSEKYELRAIRRIMRDVRKNPGTKARIRKLVTRPSYEIPFYPDIWLAYHRILKQTGLGKQYYLIACYAREAGINDFNVSLVHFEGGRGYRAVRDSGGVYRVDDPDGIEHYRLDGRKTEKNLYKVFENVDIPPSFVNTKDEEIEKMKEMGYEETISKTWFCQRPFHGEPCGMCGPCRDAIEMGLTWRFTPEGLKRHEMDKTTPKWKHRVRDYALTADTYMYNFRGKLSMLAKKLRKGSPADAS